MVDNDRGRKLRQRGLSQKRWIHSGSVAAAFTMMGLVSISGCDSTSSETTSSDGVKVGQFIDSPVTNLAYRTSTQSGFTNANGEYSYRSGETVTFSIGSIDLPSAPARAVVTPLNLAGTDDTSNTTVLNISRLLISLDTDGDPDNGITIGDQAHSVAAAMSLDFDSTEFEAASTNLVANSGSVNSSLVSAIFAQRHLESQLAVIPRDRDDDGVIDTEDAFPDDPTETADADSDGVGNNADYAPNDPGIQTICQSDAPVSEKEAAGCSNIPPVAIAGDDQTVAPQTRVTLDASSSFDVDSGSLVYSWSIISQPLGSIASTIDINALETEFGGGDLEGEYVIQLTVIDEFGASATDQQVITVDKSLPTALALFFSANVLYASFILFGRRNKIHGKSVKTD